MPYKNKEKQREYDKERKRKTRQGRTERVEQGRTKEGRTDNGMTEQGLTKEGTFFKGDAEYVPASYGLPERRRYLKLSDGQVLDRANQPIPNKHLPAMLACNRVKEYRNTMSKQEKLGRLLVSLNKEITGLDGKKLNLLQTVRYGIGGPTFAEIKNAIK